MGQHLGHPGDKKEATDNLSVASFCGGPKEDRTPDLLTASQARSQLRHRPIKSKQFATT